MNAKLQISAEVLSSKIGHEKVLISIEACFYFALAPVRDSVWTLLERQPGVVDELVNLLIGENYVDKETYTNDYKLLLIQDFKGNDYGG